MFWNVPCSGFVDGHSGLCLVHFSFAKKKNPSERYRQKERDGTLHGLE